LGINQSTSISNKRKIQIERLKVQKQELEKNYCDAVTNLNHILTQTSFSIEVTRHLQQEINKKLLTAPRLNPIMFKCTNSKKQR
jgi:ketopantoate reductase